MEGHINTYGGMDKDTAYDSLKQSSYIDAVDIRISTDKGESQGAFTNMKGNQEIFQIRDESAVTDPFHPWTASSPEIIGYGTIRNSIILFVADDTGTKGWIYEVKYDPASREILSGYPRTIYYNDNLNFKKEWPIEALGRYENQETQRIYWTDYNNYFRSLNIQDPSNISLSPGEIDIFPDIAFNTPLLSAVTGGGALKSGKYQISYRLITSDGKETLIAPPSNMIPIYDSNITGNYPAIYGNPEATVTGKTIEVTVDTSAYTEFQEIEFVALYYETSIATPIAISIEKQTLTSGPGAIATLVYTGDENSILDLDLFTFTTKNFAFKTFKTLAQKDNYLVGANVKSSTIDVQDLLDGGTFDARTYRYNPAGQTPFPIGGTEQEKLDNAFNLEFNKDKHWDVDWHTNEQFKYKADLSTLGGDGPNISYTFHMEAMSIDGDVQAKFHNQGGPFYQSFDNHNLQDGYGTRTNTGFPDNTSPFISGLLRGYKRGETYRFGIIFYTLKGEATFVEYIGDIKFPDISEEDSANNASQSPYFPVSITGQEYNPALASTLTVGMNLGIKFRIDFASCPNLLNNITGFQIVRVPRTNTDKRRLSSGVLRSYFWNRIIPTGGGTGASGFDFRVESSENVVHLFQGSEGSAPNNDVFTLRHFMDEQDPNIAPGIQLNISNGQRIRSQHLAFISPEITYDFSGVKEIGSEVGNNPAFLMTGVFNTDYEDIDTSTHGLNNLMPNTADAILFDRGHKLRSTHPVTFNSIENIKRLKGALYFDMRDSLGITLSNRTGFLGQSDNAPAINVNMNGPSYARPFYASVNVITVPTSGLNDPFGGGRTLSGPTDTRNASLIARGPSNITALIDKYNSDPLTGIAINPANISPVDYFVLNGQTTYVPGVGNQYRQIQPFELTGTPALNPIDMVNAVPMADLVIPKNEAYGGNSQSALENNDFITASPLIQTTFGTNLYEPEVFGGDIFINMFQPLDSQVELNQAFYVSAGGGAGSNNFFNGSTVRNLLFAVESVINIDLDYGATVSRGARKDVLGQEESYYRQEDSNTSTNFGQLAPGEGLYRMFGYNEVFSKENKEVLFFIKPESLIESSLTNDVRAYLSSVKTNGELIDSWTKFGINDFYDVDDHGPINKIVNFKDNVYFLQDQGTGVYAINREAVTTTDDGVPTELGTSKGWGKHQYYSKENGSIHQWAVAVTDRGIYFFDAIHRKIFQLSAAQTGMSNAPLSEVKGMHSYLQELGPAVFKRKEDGGDNPIISRGAHIGVDEINDEIIFTFLSSTLADLFDFKSIVFDEVTGTFSTRLSITPKMWINNGNTLLTTTLDTGVRVWAHNIGNWGEFYGTQTGCELTLVINPKADINKVLRFLEFNSIVRDDDKVIDRTKTITGFKIATETQASDSIYETTPDSLTRIKRRFDKWRIKLPRDVNSTSQKGRFRSTHFLLTLYFDNTYNKELIMNRLVSYYDPQIF